MTLQQSACIICARRPHKFAEKGIALCMDCFKCPEFNNRAYAKNQRRENGEKTELDHPQAESHAETQGSLFRKE
jgi:hypothetical protein